MGIKERDGQDISKPMNGAINGPMDGTEPSDIEDQLLQGAIDLHAHAYPEFSIKMRGRVDDIQWAELARAAGMRASVMKSQVFPTVE